MVFPVNANISSWEPAADRSGLRSGGPLAVVLACEDFASGMHALCAFDPLFTDSNSGHPSGGQGVWKSIWKFELLEIASLRKAAEAEAAAAQLVVLSAHAPGELSP